MGNSSSSRKVTVHNENGISSSAHGIKLSDSVTQRIKGSGTSTPPVQQPPLAAPVIHAEATITALQVRQEKEAQLRANDAYWRQHLGNLQDAYNKSIKKIEDEYEAAAQEVIRSFQQVSTKDTGPKEYPCPEARQQLVSCYLDHPRQPLLCSKQVNIFQACVQDTMMGVLQNRG